MYSERGAGNDDWQWLGDPLATVEELERRFAAREPEVLAFVPEPGRFERLARQASELRERWSSAGARPPLYGVPVAIKDVFHVDGFPTRAGSRLPPEVLAGPQSPAVSDLLAAGALIVGKAACTEFAYFAPGPTHNPLRHGYTPGGSRSGSAAAVAAGLCPLALGTQTIGSISRPAVFCGVAGYKPTYDRISRQGMLPLAPSFDHVGPLAPNVGWLRRAAAVLCQEWQEADEPPASPILAIPEGPYLEHASAPSREALESAAERLRVAGLHVERVPLLEDFEEIHARHQRWVAFEARAAHERWLPRHAELYHPETLELLSRGEAVSADRHAADARRREAWQLELAAVMDERGIDLWLSPATPGEAPEGLDSTGDPVMNLPWSQSGLPTVAFPTEPGPGGMPLGIQLAARRGADEELLAWAETLEEILAAAERPADERPGVPIPEEESRR